MTHERDINATKNKFLHRARSLYRKKGGCIIRPSFGLYCPHNSIALAVVVVKKPINIIRIILMSSQLNGLSIEEVREKIKLPLTRIEIARDIGVTNKELNKFVLKHITKPLKVINRIRTGIRTEETPNSIRIICYYPSGSIRKIKSESIKKNAAQVKIDEWLEIKIKEYSNFLDEKNRASSIGNITHGIDYTIPGLHFVCDPHSKKSNIIRITVAVSKGDKRPRRVVVKNYSEFCEAWVNATSALTEANNFNTKPKEWITPPPESYYKTMIDRFSQRLTEKDRG